MVQVSAILHCGGHELTLFVDRSVPFRGMRLVDAVADIVDASVNGILVDRAGGCTEDVRGCVVTGGLRRTERLAFLLASKASGQLPALVLWQIQKSKRRPLNLVGCSTAYDCSPRALFHAPSCVWMGRRGGSH